MLAAPLCAAGRWRRAIRAEALPPVAASLGALARRHGRTAALVGGLGAVSLALLGFADPQDEAPAGLDRLERASLLVELDATDLPEEAPQALAKADRAAKADPHPTPQDAAAIFSLVDIGLKESIPAAPVTQALPLAGPEPSEPARSFAVARAFSTFAAPAPAAPVRIDFDAPFFALATLDEADDDDAPGLPRFWELPLVAPRTNVLAARTDPGAVRAEPGLANWRERPGAFSERGIASYYWQAQMTSSGQRFDPEAMTAAHKTLPLGTRIKVTNERTGKAVVVRINDRGPFIKGRIVDLSRAAARQIGLTETGLAQVTLTVVE